MSSGNQTVTPDSGKVLSSVTIEKPATMLPENIKKDVVIGDVTGTFEGGGGGTHTITFASGTGRTSRAYYLTSTTKTEFEPKNEGVYSDVYSFSIQPSNDIQCVYCISGSFICVGSAMGGASQQKISAGGATNMTSGYTYAYFPLEDCTLLYQDDD